MEKFSFKHNKTTETKTDSIMDSWQSAAERMESVTDDKRSTELYNLTALNDVSAIEEYLHNNSINLKLEEKLFLEMSLYVKKDAQIKPNESVNVSDAEYNEFINTGNVSNFRIKYIAEKIKNTEKLTDKEIAMYSAKSVEIENIIKNFN